MFIGFIGLFIFVGDVFAIVNIVRSSVPTDKKILWALLIVILPLLGLLIWFAAGPRSKNVH